MEINKVIDSMKLQAREQNSLVKSQRASREVIKVGKETRISRYKDEIAKPADILNQIDRLRACFKANSDTFYSVLSERIAATQMTQIQLLESVNNLLDNFKYKEINISDVIGFDKYVRLYSYNEVCNLVTEHKASFEDFQIVKIKGEIYRVLKTEIAKK